MKKDDEILVAFQTLLDSSPNTKEQTVELSALRRLAARGIPSHPPHLRSVTYSLLLGVLGKRKSDWEREQKDGRAKYAQFMETLLKEVENAPTPSHPLSPNDKLLDSIAKDVHRTQTHLNFFSQPISTQPTSPSTSSPQNPEPSPFQHRAALIRRLQLIQSAAWPAQDGTDQTGYVNALKEGFEGEGLREPPSPNRSIRSDGTIRPEDHDGLSFSPSSSRRNSLALPALPPLDLSFLSRAGDASSSAGEEQSTPLATSSATFSSTLNIPSPSTRTPVDEPRSEPPLDIHLPVPPAFTPELHSDALTRILYIFTLIHPHLAYTQGFAELLAPLYYVYASGSDEKDERRAEHQAVVEGDTFWAFVGLMAEIGEVVKGPGESVWSEELEIVGGRVERDVKWALKRLSNRVKWADALLWESLRNKSLDPALPYYSFKWISTLLAQDVPMESLLRIWDLILSEPSTTRTETPKVDLLLDVCTAMLLLARKPLLQAGKRRSGQVGLWGDTDEVAGDFGEGFIEGMAYLQRYPLHRVGLDNVIELAQESRQRRILADLNGDGPEDETLSAVVSTPAPSASSFAARLFRTSHRPSSSISSVSEEGPETDFPDDSSNHSASSKSSRYSLMLKKVEAFKESDTAAALSKQSSNLTAAALARWEDYNKPQRLPPVSEDDNAREAVSTASTTKSSNRSSWTAKLWGNSKPDPSSAPPPISKDPRPDSFQKAQSGESSTRSADALGFITPSTSFASDLSSNVTVTPTGVTLTPSKRLQERLAAKLSTPAIVTPDRTLSRSPSLSHSAPKPLLLSSSARPSVSSSPHGFGLSPSMTRRPSVESSASCLSPLSASGSSSPPPTFATRQPVSPYGSESEGGSSSRVPIGSRRSFSGSVGTTNEFSPISGNKTSFLKTSGNTHIKLREKPAGLNGLEDRFTRAPPRSPRTRTLNRPRSTASSYTGSDSDSVATRSVSRLSSGDGSQRGWTLVDDAVSTPRNGSTDLSLSASTEEPQPTPHSTRTSTVPSNVLGSPLLSSVVTSSSHTKDSVTSPSTPSFHTYRAQPSSPVFAVPGSPIGPRGPRKVSGRQSAASRSKPARPISLVSNTTDADDEGSTVGDGAGYDDLLDDYSQQDDKPNGLSGSEAAVLARKANRF